MAVDQHRDITLGNGQYWKAICCMTSEDEQMLRTLSAQAEGQLRCSLALNPISLCMYVVEKGVVYVQY